MQLDVELVWHDLDMVEVRIDAANLDFRGCTSVYTTRQELLELAERVALFPRTAKDTFEFVSLGETPRVTLQFYCIDGAGHGAVRAMLRREVVSTMRPEEEDDVVLEVLLAGSSVVDFAKALRRIVRDQAGTASLFPRSRA